MAQGAADPTATPAADWLGQLDGRRLTVEVPASSANLGAGYDCLGVALELLNVVELEVRAWSRGGVELEVEGEGAGELEAGRGNRFVVALEAALKEARGQLPDTLGWFVRMRNRIPLARGLGSSASATVAGLVAADTLLDGHYSRLELLAMATRLEGHADNAAAALLGGFVAVDTSGERPEAIRFDAPRDLRAVLFIPDLRLETKAMRAVLPRNVPRADAVANLSRVAIGVAGLALGRSELLRVLTVDRLHEPYRAKAYPQLPLMVEAARNAGAIGACLSGAGSTIVAFSDSVSAITRIEAGFMAAAVESELPGRVEIVMPRNEGARVLASA